MKLYSDMLDTPIGAISIEADDENILKILFDQENIEISPNVLTQRCKSQLREYFKGTRTEFDLPIKFHGTDFQEQAWQALRHIPFGQTATYGEQARHMKKPKAVRAVGSANGKNKICIAVPCHRIIGADGSLTGYGAGINRKKWLLDHERKALILNQ
ncbi:methylated-DNA--[protein]-cysteine S-methyltransferase [bacterium]|nr:methylated-DNA--[protein]-cysteine S-methyltransferase [bacterium]